MTQTYTPFTPHSDTVQELIEAGHLNELQEALNETQLSVNEHGEQLFLAYLFHQFDHQDQFNAIHHGFFGRHYLDEIRCSNLLLDEERRGIKVDDPLFQGVLTTKPIQSHLSESIMKKIILVTSFFVKEGMSVQWSILLGEEETLHPIEPYHASSLTLLPSELETDQFRLRVVMKANELGESPILYQWACFYEDVALSRRNGTTL